MNLSEEAAQWDQHHQKPTDSGWQDVPHAGRRKTAAELFEEATRAGWASSIITVMGDTRPGADLSLALTAGLEGSSLAARPDDDIILVIANGRDRIVLIVTYDGQMYFNEDFSPSEQADAFRQAMNMVAGQAVFATAVPSK